MPSPLSLMSLVGCIGRPHDNADGGRPTNAVAPAVSAYVAVDMVAHCTGLLNVAVSVCRHGRVAVRFDHHHQTSSTTFTQGPVHPVQCCRWSSSIGWLVYSCRDKAEDDVGLVVNVSWSTWWCRHHHTGTNGQHALGDDRQSKDHCRRP